MLKVFRDNLKYLSWVLWLVIAVFVLFVFVDFGATVPGGTTAPSEAAATVGGYDITYGEFERAYRQAEDFYRQAYGEQFNRELAQQIGLPLQVLDGLVAEKILMGEADRVGLRVTDDEIARYIKGIPTFQMPDGRFVGNERYQQILRSNGYTADQFERSVRTDLVKDKMRTVLAENLYVSDAEIEAAYRHQVETAKVRYIRMPASLVGDEVEIDDESVVDYYEANAEELRFPEKRVVDYLLIDPNEVDTGTPVTDEDIRRYYEENSEEFRREEQVRARHILLQVNDNRTEERAEAELAEIRERVTRGEDFAVLAGEISDDPGSKNRGGDLGFFGRGQMIPEFEEAAFGAEPGSIVGPIRTSFGYHLIQILEKQPAGEQPFEDVAQDIRVRLEGERSRTAAETKAGELADRIREENISQADGLRDMAASETGVTVETTPAFGRDENVVGIGRGTAFTTTAFELAVGEASDPVQVARGWTVLMVSQVQPPRLPELTEVRSEVEAAVRREKELLLATQKMTIVREAVAAGQALESAAEDLGLAVVDTEALQRYGPVTGLGNSPDLVAAALALEVGDIGGPVVHQRDVVLFEVIERQHFDPAEFMLQREQTAETLRAERLDQMLAALVDKRREELGVEYDTQLLRNFELVPDAG